MISPRNTAIGMLFQLTPSRRATSSSPALVTARTISTHALTEGDIVTFLSVVVFAIFQLTPSRRATVIRKALSEWLDISTHALTEGDQNPESEF